MNKSFFLSAKIQTFVQPSMEEAMKSPTSHSDEAVVGLPLVEEYSQCVACLCGHLFMLMWGIDGCASLYARIMLL
jgi:hypothetical protein